ncbi:MAG TPA: hypothetical protein ENI87_03065 [bacterium]|nr:hypothetical protein [bacterium]
MTGFKETLKDALRQMAFRTSIDKLKKKGVHKVNVLGLDRIIALVEAAVHKSLQSRLAGIERDAVAESTKAEFVRLLRSNEDLQRQKSEVERARERAEQEIDRMRRELNEKQQALKLKLEQNAVELANRYDGENAEIARKVSAVVQSLASDDDGSAGTVEERLMALIMDVISGEREKAEAAQRALHDREVVNLQRRIRKLNDTLSTTEQRLQQVSAQKDVDTGISSIYREVQGLDESDAQAGKKKELMATIFQANLKLQKRSRGA